MGICESARLRTKNTHGRRSDPEQTLLLYPAGEGRDGGTIHVGQHLKEMIYFCVIHLQYHVLVSNKTFRKTV